MRFGVHSVVFLTLIVVAGYASMARADNEESADAEVKKAKVANIKVSGSLTETAGAFGLFGEIEPDLRDMVRRLDKAAADDDIQAVVLKIRDPIMGRGKLEELRSAIARARQAGKTIVADLESATTSDYLLACACDEIIMPESGTLMIPGIRAEVTFFASLFEKLGIEADMMQVGDFKGAAEPFTRKSMSAEFRAQYERLIDDLYGQMIESIARDRGLDNERVKALIDVGLFTPDAAKEAGLIDTVAYADEIELQLQQRLSVDEIDTVADYGKKTIDTDFSGMLGFIKLFDLMMGGSSAERASSKDKVALVYAVGPIMTGSSSTDLFGLSTLGSETLVKALRKANDDDTVKAVVMRVDSPGGSALASDLIWHEIDKIEKPVIASMGDVAASGGYYISMGCDKIYAEPGTLTGSIGVVGGKLAVGGLMHKAGITTDVISRGENSGILSMEEKFTDSERDAWEKMLRDVYRQFTEKAADGRSMTLDDLQKLAGGRVWTGRQAKENGLVDEVGTLRDALLAAKQAAGIAEDEKVELLILPKATNFFDQLLGMPDASALETVRTGIDAFAPGASQRLACLEVLRKLFAEKAVLIAPYHVEIK